MVILKTTKKPKYRKENRIMSKNRQIYESWRDIQEIIGEASKWPAKIRRSFWIPGAKHFDRILLVTFVIVNGLNPEMFMDWARLIGLGNDEAAYRHFSALFKILPEKNYSGLYAYNVTQNRYEYLDGRVRHYTHASKRNKRYVCNNKTPCLGTLLGPNK